MRNKFKMQLAMSTGLLLALSLSFGWSTDSASANDNRVPGQYIIVLAANVSPGDAANDLGRQHGLGLGHIYRHALKGFSATVPTARLEQLRADERVVSVTPDQYVSIVFKPPCPTPPCGGGGGGGGGGSQPTQSIPTGILRINGDLSSTVAGNGTGIVDVDVAVVDTGIQSHSDLNIAGGVNCSTGNPRKYTDGHGHGTHVGGTIGALDNGIGVVGVAPGARLWAVRVLNDQGSGTRSDVICGIDWVTANANIIEVANMSLGGSGSDDGLSCAQTPDPYKKAICNSVAAGVTYAVAAGNSADDAANHVPAAYDMVITVSALADFDGESGGQGTPTCRTDQDDTLADFSNYGRDVDIIAPGVCINSTWLDGGYNTISGTSMASPHVAGAAALYKSTHPNASPLDVQNALRSAGNANWNNSGDPDGIKENLLDVASY